MTLSVMTSQIEGLDALVLEAGDVLLTVLPQHGAKVLSLVWLPTGYEYLWRQPDRPLHVVEYGGDFEAGDISGWDECFPTIGQCVYPEQPWGGVVVPDHGELWALAWDWTVEGESLRMWTDGVRFPYRFERSFRVDRTGRIDITYEVENRAPFALRALWSMHPFFRVAPDTRILLPEPTTIRIEVAKANCLGGYLAEHPRPVTRDRDGERVDLSLVGPRDTRFMEKVFTRRLTDGWAALFTLSNEQHVALTFDPAVVPYVGIAAMRGGWPETGEPSYSVILEPCTGWPDRLDIAVPRGDAMTIPGKASAQWTVTMHVGRSREWLERVIERVTG